MKTTAKRLLGARIKEIRKLKGFSQDKLAEKIDIDTKHLSRIEVGGSYPSLDTLDRIAKALGVDMKDFFEVVEESKKADLVRSAVNLIKEADEAKLKLLIKIARAIVR
ncbi:MAG: helix-turn-helix domain-containing protein [Nitrospirota bacterium]|nr:helix-turn-helix domain-containing protein [Nitrospirota bacterium]